MTDKMKKGIPLVEPDTDKVLNDVRNDKISSDTTKALSRIFNNMHKYNVGKSFRKDGYLGITETGVDFHLANSDVKYHYCAESGEITKLTSEVIQIS